MNNIQAASVKFSSRILGQEELPVENIILNNVRADTILEKDFIRRNVLDFNIMQSDE